MNPPTPLQYSQPLYPTPYPPNRTAAPARTFGIIYLILAVLSVFGFFVLLGMAFLPGLVQADFAHNDPISATAPRIFFSVLAAIVGLSLILHAVAAYGLLALRPWGRTFAIVVSIITLLSLPLGTIIGGICLYFLLRQGAQQEYDRLVSQKLGLPPAYPGTYMR